MEKKQLPLEDLKLVISILWEIHSKRTELTQAFFEDEKGFLDQCPNPFSWAQLFDYSLDELAAMLLVTLDQDGQLVKELQKHKSLVELQKVFESYTDLEPVDLGEGVEKAQYQFLAIWIGLLRTLESIQVYGRSFQRMLIDVERGSDKALFDMVKLDHAIVGHTTIQRRLAIAELKKDKKFFVQLANALKSRPVKHSPKLYPVRYVLTLLEELGQLDNLTEIDAHRLFCLDLKIYPDTGEDSSRSLWQFIYRWKKENVNPYST